MLCVVTQEHNRIILESKLTTMSKTININKTDVKLQQTHSWNTLRSSDQSIDLSVKPSLMWNVSSKWVSMLWPCVAIRSKGACPVTTLVQSIGHKSVVISYVMNHILQACFSSPHALSHQDGTLFFQIFKMDQNKAMIY